MEHSLLLVRTDCEYGSNGAALAVTPSGETNRPAESHVATEEVRRPTEKCSRRGTPWTLRPRCRPTTALLGVATGSLHAISRRRPPVPNRRRQREAGRGRPHLQEPRQPVRRTRRLGPQHRPTLQLRPQCQPVRRRTAGKGRPPRRYPLRPTRHSSRHGRTGYSPRHRHRRGPARLSSRRRRSAPLPYAAESPADVPLRTKAPSRRWAPPLRTSRTCLRETSRPPRTPSASAGPWPRSPLSPRR